LPFLRTDAQVLDLGAGQGYFSQLLGNYLRSEMGVEPSAVLRACDVVPSQFRYSELSCDQIPERGRLPYADGTFDLVCSLEVIEHVEDQFEFAREAYRVLKPGGAFLLSTPNVLNMNSRWRFLHSGFPVLFDPLSLNLRDVVHTSGHIHPVSFYYLHVALRAAGFAAVNVHYDHFKRSAAFQLIVLGPLLLLGRLGFLLRMRRKRPQEMRENRDAVRTMDSFRMLTSRSILLFSTK
jgi:SAM-dependent methyltransferase